MTAPGESTDPAQLPLRGWARELARRWNSGAYSTFILHGNIFDVFPIQMGAQVAHAPLKAFLTKRLFPQRACFLFYDIGGGLSFGSAEMQSFFFRWLQTYDQVERTRFHEDGPPRDFLLLAPILRRFFLHYQSQPQLGSGNRGMTLAIDFPEKIVPAAEDAGTSPAERIALVHLLKWATSSELRESDVAILLITESAAELHSDLLQNPHVAQVKIELPNYEQRLDFLTASASLAPLAIANQPSASLSPEELATQTAGLSLLRIQQLVAEAARNNQPLSRHHVSASKKRLIEEFCQGLVRFKEPKPHLSLDSVATHAAAKKRLREIAWLIQHSKFDVVERGILLPGRVGVGKSFLVDCFASECGLPVLEIGEFRSKWVGDTERQQARILMTIRALGPVVVVVDEADAVFGTRQAEGDSGVSGRVFAAFAAHIGDASLRGRELWLAMTSRPDLLAIDMKRQGRFGLCIPLFPAQSADEVLELFQVIARAKKISLPERCQPFIQAALGHHPLTGSDVESILMRAKERAVLAQRDAAMELADLQEAIQSFVDPLDPHSIALQELAAVLACSDLRYLPQRYSSQDRSSLVEQFNVHKLRLGLPAAHALRRAPLAPAHLPRSDTPPEPAPA